MAGVHLASLYESDRNEFNRLIEQVVLPRKEEFRYLLYFTVSQNKTFESQDPDVAALVKDRLSSLAIMLTLSEGKPAHTVAAYAFIGPHLVQNICCLFIKTFTPASSHHLAEALCSMPNLNDLSFCEVDVTEEFYPTLKAQASSIQVKTLHLDDPRDPTPVTSQHLAEALCSMPNLTKLTLLMDLPEEFYFTLEAHASSIKVQTLTLCGTQCPKPASSHHLVEALCSMPNLADLTLEMGLHEEFYSRLKAKALFIKVKTLKLGAFKCPTPAESHHLADALCSMPNLTDLTLDKVHNDIYSTLKANASSIQVQTLKLHLDKSPKPHTSHHLAEALCSIPNLSDLTLHGEDLTEEFFSTLKAMASSIQVQTLKLDVVKSLTPASSHHLVEALCSMPNLNDLTLNGRFLNKEFYSSLKAMASSIQVQTLKLDVVKSLTPASSHHLVEALCSMPNLNDLTLNGRFLNEEFYSSLKAMASSIQPHRIT
eukprot:XP_011670798.1 PREDICTED: uncharacterized protein LOC105441412 [Strongylocentrotus purpuratus]